MTSRIFFNSANYPVSFSNEGGASWEFGIDELFYLQKLSEVLAEDGGGSNIAYFRFCSFTGIAPLFL